MILLGIVKKIVISVGILLIILHVASTSLLGVSVLSLGKDAFDIMTAPTVDEIKEMPVEEVNDNFQDVLEDFGEEELKLNEGIVGVRVMAGDKVVEELTMEIKDGQIVDIDYSGLPEGVPEEMIVEIPELAFRTIASGNTPENLPELLEKAKS